MLVGLADPIDLPTSVMSALKARDAQLAKGPWYRSPEPVQRASGFEVRIFEQTIMLVHSGSMRD